MAILLPVVFSHKSLLQCTCVIIYLQVVADFNRDFGEGNSNSSVLCLAEPGVHLCSGQEFLQALQGLQVVGHDEDHRGLFLTQRHVQDEDLVLGVIVEVIQTWTEHGR